MSICYNIVNYILTRRFTHSSESESHVKIMINEEYRLSKTVFTS